MDKSQIEDITAEWKPWLVEVRRDLHRHPELGLSEFRTSAQIIRHLEQMGVEWRKLDSGTAVVGLIKGKYAGKTVAVRADMDALPIQEENNVPYRSQNNGVMHACGHDAHMAILLGTARLFSLFRSELHGNVKLFFQPAEETVGGAGQMVRMGCMEDPHVDFCIGLHVVAYLPVGKIETRAGVLNGAGDMLHIAIHGQKAHGAYPDLGSDAVTAAAYAVTAAQTFVSREISPLDSAVFTVGTINGGVKSNIIADEVKMEAILRTVGEDTRAKAQERIPQIIKEVAAALKCDARVDIEPGYKPLVNDAGVVDTIIKAARETLGEHSTVLRSNPSLGVEDFSYFLDQARGAFYHLGCGNAEKKIVSPAHTPTFDIDEDCLVAGVRMHAAVICRLLGADIGGRDRDGT